MKRRLAWYDRGPMPYIVVGGVLFAVVATLLAVVGLYGHLAYGDWTCGFKHCIEVTDLQRGAR